MSHGHELAMKAATSACSKTLCESAPLHTAPSVPSCDQAHEVIPTQAAIWLVAASRIREDATSLRDLVSTADDEPPPTSAP